MKAEYDKLKIINENHWISKTYRQRLTAKEWKQVLLNNDDHITFEGRVRRLVAKKLGYGIVEIAKEQK